MKRLLIVMSLLVLMVGSVSGATIDNLVSYWKFDEASGDAIDAHGSYDGTTSGITYGVTGKINDCFTFTSGDYVDMGDQADFEHTDGFSWSIWMKPTNTINAAAVSSFFFLMSKNEGGTVDGDVMIFWDANNPFSPDDGHLLFMITEGATDYACYSNANSFTADTWYHVVVTYDDATLKMYVDGVLQDDEESLAGSDVGTNAAPLRVCAHSATAFTFLGEADEVGVWDRALTQSEVTALYNSGNGLAYPFAAVAEFIPRRRKLLLGGR